MKPYVKITALLAFSILAACNKSNKPLPAANTIAPAAQLAKIQPGISVAEISDAIAKDKVSDRLHASGSAEGRLAAKHAND